MYLDQIYCSQTFLKVEIQSGVVFVVLRFCYYEN